MVTRRATVPASGRLAAPAPGTVRPRIGHGDAPLLLADEVLPADDVLTTHEVFTTHEVLVTRRRTAIESRSTATIMTSTSAM